MKPLTMIYGSSDIADLMGISHSRMSNYLARYDDTPTPEYVTQDGRKFWSDNGLIAWMEWMRA